MRSTIEFFQLETCIVNSLKGNYYDYGFFQIHIFVIITIYLKFLISLTINIFRTK